MKKIFIALLLIISFIGNSQTINEIQKILAVGGDQNDLFGAAVDVDGNMAIVGAYQKNSYKGIAYIFEFNGLNWVQTATIEASDGGVDEYFGCSVAISGNRVIIGAKRDENPANSTPNDEGSAYIFEFNGTTWLEKAKFYASYPINYGYYAESVDISGNYAVVGASAINNGIDAGCVYVYKFNGVSWIEQVRLLASDGIADDFFGWSVAIENNRILVGAEGDDDSGVDSGSAYVFEFDGTNWNETQKIIASDGVAGDRFGWDVGLSNDRIIIGAYGSDDLGLEAGAAYLYHFNGSIWNQMDKIVASDGFDGDRFGRDVAINGNFTLIGVESDDDNGSGSGSGYIFEFRNGNWDEIAKLIASDAATNDNLGQGVAISNNHFLIGAHRNDDLGSESGSAYFFKKPKGVYGTIYHDFNQNCFKENNNIGLANRFGLIMPGNIIVQTNSGGNWYIDSLQAGNYTITYDTSGNWLATCTAIQNFTVVNPDSLLMVPKFGLISTNPCISPNISTHMQSLRKCFNDQKIFIRASNEPDATSILNNGYVDLELDSLITPTSASITYTPLGNNVYRFILSNTNLYPGQDEIIVINSLVSCDAIQGLTLCLSANLYPVDSCVFDTIPANIPDDFTPCNLPWDNSSISLNGWCDNDSIYFTITNNGVFGNGDMECYSPIRLFIDGQYIRLDSIQLLGGETDTLVFSGDGRTWRLEVDQHPLHPGNSQPNFSIELCGNSANWSSNFFNNLPLDDANQILDIYCRPVTTSYDPNDKTGYPLGVTDSHYVTPNGKIEFVINFQNTGSDTAFTVIVRDTLDLDLNIFSVASGVSSHNYTFRMYGPRILEWTFDHILLPDSTIDESGSHGFVTFEVDQIPDLPDGTEINNEVGIYFDFNAPVITNTTSHVIYRDIYSPSWTQEITNSINSCSVYSINNSEYNNSGQYYNLNGDTLIILNLVINPSPLVEAGSDTTICSDQSIILNGTGANLYSWSNNVQNGISFIPLTNETYHLIGIDSNGCSAIDSITINLIASPEVNFTFTFNNFEITLEDSSSIDVNNWYWTIDGDSLTIQSTAQYLFTQNGSYEICLIASNDCFSDTTCQQIDITTIGIDDLNSLSGIKIYPNPTHSYFTIEISEINNSLFEITDITGKIISIGILKDKLTNIDLSNVANGIYLLKVESETVKILKQ